MPASLIVLAGLDPAIHVLIVHRGAAALDARIKSGHDDPPLPKIANDAEDRRRVWCGREDSNFHGVSPTATSTLRVYQFRHDRTAGGWSRIWPRGGVISKSAFPYQATWDPAIAAARQVRSSGR